ncbi:MAG TPA: EamA family transporter, partial [Longimicrobiales bacterium]|nr:EamA family transporter [Longimicrobiales bacterium]
ITGRKALAVALTLSGVALVALASDPSVRLSGGAIAWGLVAGVAYASYYLFGKRYFERYPAPTVFLYALPLGALALAPLVRWSATTPADWLVILWLAGPPTYLAYLVYSIGLRRVEAGRAATVATLEPVVAALLAYAMWGEALGAWGYAGAALVLAGVLLTTRKRGGRDEVESYSGSAK